MRDPLTMLLLWLLAGSSILTALIALATARRLSRRLESLNHSYWELRYEYTRLRAQVARLDPEQPAADEQVPAGGGEIAFVPLSSLKRG